MEESPNDSGLRSRTGAKQPPFSCGADEARGGGGLCSSWPGEGSGTVAATTLVKKKSESVQSNNYSPSR